VKITVLPVFVSGAKRHHDGSFTLLAGRSYRIGAEATSRPTYYLPTPASGSDPIPSVRGPKMSKAGHHLWSAPVGSPARGRRGVFNVGIEIGQSLTIVKIRFV
jgi:hypothetical protein